jgi:hypothetical protein
MPIYRFVCEDGHETEDIVPMGTDQIACPHWIIGLDSDPYGDGPDVTAHECGKTAKHVPQTSVGRPQGGPTPIHFPGRGTR